MILGGAELGRSPKCTTKWGNRLLAQSRGIFRYSQQRCKKVQSQDHPLERKPNVAIPEETNAKASPGVGITPPPMNALFRLLVRLLYNSTFSTQILSVRYPYETVRS